MVTEGTFVCVCALNSLFLDPKKNSATMRDRVKNICAVFHHGYVKDKI